MPNQPRKCAESNKKLGIQSDIPEHHSRPTIRIKRNRHAKNHRSQPARNACLLLPLKRQIEARRLKKPVTEFFDVLSCETVKTIANHT